MTLHPESALGLPGPSSKRAVSDSKAMSSSAGLMRAVTPPPASERGRLESRRNLDNTLGRSVGNGARASDVGRGSPFDPDAVDHALFRELARPQRESTPSASPHRKRQRINGDRFV